MGTRADFYVGRGTSAEWIGSIAWDGYPSGITKAVRKALTAADFRGAVKTLLQRREDATTPEQGWPWPWDTSKTTDYAYAFDAGKVWYSGFGGPWCDASDLRRTKETGANAEFPVMGQRGGGSAAPGSQRSGLMVISIKS